MAQRDELGKGTVGFLFSLAVIGSLIFVGFKIIPVRIDAYSFHDVLRQEVRMGAVRNSNAVVAKRILEQAQELDIPLEPKNLSVQRFKTKMVVSARYEQPIDLKFTTYVFRFEAKEEAPLF